MQHTHTHTHACNTHTRNAHTHTHTHATHASNTHTLMQHTHTHTCNTRLQHTHTHTPNTQRFVLVQTNNLFLSAGFSESLFDERNLTLPMSINHPSIWAGLPFCSTRVLRERPLVCESSDGRVCKHRRGAVRHACVRACISPQSTCVCVCVCM